MNDKFDNEIASENENIINNQKLKEEIAFLNKKINSCIEMISASVSGKKTREKLDYLKDESNMSYEELNNKIDNNINDSKINIAKLTKLKKESSNEKKDGRNE